MRCSLEACQKEILSKERYQLVPIDRPYFNVYFHKECYHTLLEQAGSWENIYLYLAKNPQLWYNRRDKHGKTSRKRRKSRGF